MVPFCNAADGKRKVSFSHTAWRTRPFPGCGLELFRMEGMLTCKVNGDTIWSA